MRHGKVGRISVSFVENVVFSVVDLKYAQNWKLLRDITVSWGADARSYTVNFPLRVLSVCQRGAK